MRKHAPDMGGGGTPSPTASRFSYVAFVTSEPIKGLPSQRIYGPFDSNDEAWAALRAAKIIDGERLAPGWASAGALPLRAAETLAKERP